MGQRWASKPGIEIAVHLTVMKNEEWRKTMKRMILSLIVMVLFTGALAAQSADNNWKYFISGYDADLFDEGIKQAETGKLAEAAETFELLLGRKTLSAPPYFWLAGIYSQIEQPENTAAACEKILYRFFPHGMKRLAKPSYKNPLYSQFYYILGSAYLELDRYYDAAAAFKKILKSHNYKKTNSYNFKIFYPASQLSPDGFYALVHYKLGIAYSSRGDRDEAMKQYKELNKLDKEKAEKLLEIINR
jgi:tetratricopeptide (TPR) repeat protein